MVGIVRYNDDNLPPEVKKYLMLKAQKSTKTAENYRNGIHRLLAYLDYNRINLKKMTENDLDGFVNHLKRNGTKDTAISSLLQILHAFFNTYMLERGIDKDEFARMVAYCKGMKVKPTGENTNPALTEAQQDELFSKLKNPYLRIIAWASISYGFRAQEVCNLHMDDVKINESGINEFEEQDWGYLVIRESKGNKTRKVFILKEHIKVWKYYFRLREKDKVSFPNVFYWNHKPLKDSTYSGFFKRHISDQVSFPLTSHTLRHTFGTNLLRQGVNLVIIQNLMGHNSIDMTRKYLDVLDRETQQMYLDGMDKGKK